LFEGCISLLYIFWYHLSMKRGIDYIGVSAGALILNDKDEVFLTKRSKNTTNQHGKWEAPGGGIGFGETREEAVKREIKEELGIDIEIISLLQVVDEILPEDKQHWLATTFIAKIKPGQIPQILEPEKCDAIGWFSLDKLPDPISYITGLDIAKYREQMKK